jgi:predicted transcriptional regulator
MSSSRDRRPPPRKPDRSRTYGAARQIDDFARREKWQLADIEAGLREAEKGDFASDAGVAATIAKYTRHKRSK